MKNGAYDPVLDIGDGASKFIGAFDDVFGSDGTGIIRTPCDGPPNTRTRFRHPRGRLTRSKANSAISPHTTVEPQLLR
jgi:hypothetical protein